MTDSTGNDRSIAAARGDGAALNDLASKSHATRALVVDDNADVADTLGTLLESFGVEVQATYGGAEVMERQRGPARAM